MMMNKKTEIDITTGIKNRETIFGVSGRPLGQKQRKILEIEKIEEEYEAITVVVPSHILYMSSSFFLGLFGKSVRKYGGSTAFLTKYIFKCSKDIMVSVEEGIKDALVVGDGLDDC